MSKKKPLLDVKQLEDIWNKRPYGWYTRYMKKYKNMSRYTVTCTAYKRVSVGTLDEEVIAADSNKALNSSMVSDMSSILAKKLDIDKHDSDIIFRYTVKSSEA